MVKSHLEMAMRVNLGMVMSHTLLPWFEEGEASNDDEEEFSNHDVEEFSDDGEEEFSNNEEDEVSNEEEYDDGELSYE
jgi:hypothetical protein